MDGIPVIGISGGSAAGKTTFTAALAQQLEDRRPAVLNQDRYFRRWERDEERTTNHPRAVQWEALINDVGALAAGGAVEPPAGPPVGPGRVVLVEGHLLFGCEDLMPLLGLKVFLDVDPHERVLRRMLRDTASGQVDLESAVAWYRRDVLPNFPRYTEPTKRLADIVVPGEKDMSTAIALVAAGVRAGVMGAGGA